MKLVNYLKLLGVTIVTPMFFISCTDNNSVSCSGEVETKLVEDLNKNNLENHIIVSFLKEKYPESVLGYAYQQNAKLLLEMYSNNIKDFPVINTKDLPVLEGVSEAKEFMNKELEKYSFNLKNTRTLRKDTELNIIECTTTASYALSSYTYDMDINYKAQLTDDKKNIIVELIDN